MASFVIGADGEFFQGLTQEQQRDFFKDCTKFFANRYGNENIISAVVHMDETTPHLHLNLVPIQNGKLCCKDLFNRIELTKLQTDFHESVGKRLNLERGKEGSPRKHLSTAEYKAQKIVVKAIEKAADISDEAEIKLSNITKAVKQAESHFDDTVKQIHTVKEERDKLITERNAEADYSKVLEQAKNGDIPNDRKKLKVQVIALTVENKRLTEENTNLKRDNEYLFNTLQKDHNMQDNYSKALKAIRLFRTREPEAFARVFYRATSILQPFLPIGEQPVNLQRNRLQEIEEEIRKEQEVNMPIQKKKPFDKAD